MERAAVYMLNDWAGRHGIPCVVIGETPKRYRVKLIARSRLAGRIRYGKSGDVILMPKQAIKFTDLQPNT